MVLQCFVTKEGILPRSLHLFEKYCSVGNRVHQFNVTSLT
jgi:hypothetical protein